MRPLGLIFKNHLFGGVVSRAILKGQMVGSILFLLNVGGNVDFLEIVRHTQLLQGNGGLDAVGRGPRVEGEVGGHGRVGTDR